MSRWFRFGSPWKRDTRRDASDEISFHITARVRDLVATGLTESEARVRAEREFGDADVVRDQIERIHRQTERRDARTEWWGDLARDVRVGIRSLRASPAFSLTAILCAALGIGVTTAIVSAAYAILIRPLPYKNADRLIAIYSENPEMGYKRSNISSPDFFSWRDETRTFDGIALWTWNSITLAGSDAGAEAERVDGAQVSAVLFDLLGVRPALGRGMLPDDDKFGAQRVALISDRLWRRRYGADSALVGKTIIADGRPVTLIGVMPPRFNFPERGDVWIPFSLNEGNEIRGNRFYAGAIGRLKSGVTFEQGLADLRRIDADLEKRFPDHNRSWRSELHLLRDDLVGDLKQPLIVFLWSVALVLLMVCANVANLLLARGATRARELAVRTALGASRTRLVRQLITESFLLAGSGAAVGALLAWWGVRLLRFAFPNATPPYFIDLSLNFATLAFVLAVATVTGILFGVLPAMRAARVDINAVLRDGARGASDGLRSSRLRGALVMGELALSVVLMIGALLLLRSYHNLSSTELGFDEKGIVSARISLPGVHYPTRAHSLAFYERLLDRLRAVPGVDVAAAAQGVPMTGWDVQASIAVEGVPSPKGAQEIVTHYQVVTPEYFKAIGARLLKGRWLTTADGDSMAPGIIVNEELVRRAFPNQDPIGKRISIAGDSLATIVGVINTYRHYRLPQPQGPASFYSHRTWTPRTLTVVLRTRLDDPASLIPAIRSIVREIDPRVAVYDTRTFEEVVSRAIWRQRLQRNVLAIFASLALVLACIGLYGVISYAVAQRTRELGVRIALGASRASVLRLVFGESSRLVLTGAAIGLVAAYFGVRLLDTLLYGVETRDLVTFVSVPVVLAFVALVASLIPARRATRVDPIIAMRAD